MSKQRKKRNKKYSGADATTSRPTVTKVTAVSRSKTGQWVHERKRIIKTAGVILLIIVVIIVSVSGIISLF